MHRLPILLGAVLGLLPEVAAAALDLPGCTVIPGCGQSARELVSEALIPEIARIMLNTTAGLAVVFMVVGGGRYLLSLGREEELSKGKSTIIWAAVGMLVALMSHSIVMAVISENYVAGGDPILDFLAAAVRIMITMLNVVFLIVIVASGFRMVMARGKEDEISKGRQGFIYSLAGAIIINVAPLLVRAVLAL